MSDKPQGYVFGRPTDYRPEMCEQVIEWGKLGKSRAWIASELGVCKRTLDVWAEKHTDFLSALSLAKTFEQRWWEDKGQEHIAAQVFQSAMWGRSMAARFPDDWRETSRQEQTGLNGGPIQVAKVERVIVDPKNSNA